MSMTTNRRSFLFGASVAGFGVLVQGKRSLAWGVGTNDTLNIACIGVGGKGKGDTEHAARVGRVVAVCDIDQKSLDEMAGRQKESKKYNDYRELLHALGDQVDAVIVSTPDHTHAPAAVMAMRMGKHVYCQKPLAHTVWEARLMRETARQKGVCTQMGNQGTADSGLRRAVELVRAGAIGEVKEVHVWTNRPFNYWKQAPDIVARSQESVPIPSHVHWDLFLGTAPSGRTIPFIIRITGAAGGISGPVRLAIWPVTQPTCRSWRFSLGCRRGSRARAGRSTRRRTRGGRRLRMNSPRAATCRR